MLEKPTITTTVLDYETIEPVGISQVKSKFGRNNSSLPSSGGISSEFKSLQLHRRGDSLNRPTVHQSVSSSKDAAKFANSAFSLNSSGAQKQELLKAIE